jgi:hypothetical protein
MNKVDARFVAHANALALEQRWANRQGRRSPPTVASDSGHHPPSPSNKGHGHGYGGGYGQGHDHGQGHGHARGQDDKEEKMAKTQVQPPPQFNTNTSGRLHYGTRVALEVSVKQ